MLKALRTFSLLAAVALSWATAAAFAAPTRVTGTLNGADSQPLSGYALFSYRSFTSQDGTLLFPASTVRIRVDAGVLDIRLEPGYYVLETTTDVGGRGATLFLAIPASGGTVALTSCILVDTTKLAVSQLAQSAATTNQVLTWNGSNWIPAAVGISAVTGLQAALDARAQRPYTATITAQTSVTISAATHGLTSSAIDATCYDAGSPTQKVEPDTVTVNTSTFAVTIGFVEAFTGRCVLR